MGLSPNDFSIVKRQILKGYHGIYNGDTGPWTADDIIGVFDYFYRSYRAYMGKDHPHLKMETIRSIIEALPIVRDENGTCIDLEAEDYPAMIDRYFEIEFSNCNYSIAHFMTDGVRLRRYYEVVY